MKFYRMIILSISALIGTSTIASDQYPDGVQLPPEFLSNLPPWEQSERPPEPILENPPVYLDVDSKGNVYRHYLVQDESGYYWPKAEVVPQQVLEELRSQREVILHNMEDIDLPREPINQVFSAASTSLCPLPSSFSIVGDSAGQPSGFQKKANTYKPTGATTQWLVFDFYTTNYRDRGTHMPMIMFHDEVLHGWGAFIGDNHSATRFDGSEANCGDSARFNSQIEGWIQLPPEPSPQVSGPNWQSYTFSGTNSCGNEMYDGPIIHNWTPLPKYRLEMQASTGRWVAYRIFYFNAPTWSWNVLTDWKLIEVDANPAAWEHSPLNWQSNTQGIFIFATPAVSAGSWSINISGVQCGWF